MTNKQYHSKVYDYADILVISYGDNPRFFFEFDVDESVNRPNDAKPLKVEHEDFSLCFREAMLDADPWHALKTVGKYFEEDVIDDQLIYGFRHVHNPQGVDECQLRFGWRFLDEDEIGTGYPVLNELYAWTPNQTWIHPMFGAAEHLTYATPLSREELRKARGL